MRTPAVREPPLPNVVIAGASRAGTTSLFAWLAAHPEVCASSVKETRFLIDRGSRFFNARWNVHDQGIDGYRRYFKHFDPSRHRLVLEATPDYLPLRTPVEVLSGLDPLPRIVFMLRKPSERLYSLYQFARSNQASIDRSMTFRDYVAAARDEQPRYFRGRRAGIPRLRTGRYIESLRPWLDRFPRSHMLVLLFEDMVRGERGFMTDAAVRLGIDPAFYETLTFPSKNASYEVASPGVHAAKVRLQQLKLGRVLPQGRMKAAIRRAIQAPYALLNVRRAAADKTDDDRAVLAELDAEFAPYNRRLADELGVDLSAWDGPAKESASVRRQAGAS